MRDTTNKDEVTRTKSNTSIYNTYSSNSLTEDQIFGNNGIVNYPYPLDNISLNYKRYDNIKNNIGESKVDSASTLFYDLDTAAKKRPLNCTSELSFARKGQAFFKYKRHRVKSKLKHNMKYCQAREYSKKSIVDSETDLNESKNNFADDFKIFSNLKQTYILDADSYSKPHQYNKEKHGKDEKLCYFTKYPKENSSPFITSRRKKYNTHKLPRRSQSSTKMKTELNKHIKYSYALNKPSDTSLRLSDKKKSINNAILSHSTVKQKNPYHKDVIDEPITNLAQSSNQDTSYNLKYICRNKNNRLRKRQITCPNCQEKVQLASTTDDDKECEYKNTYYNKSIEISEAMDYKYLSNNYKSDNNSRKGCRLGPQCHIPLCKMTSSGQICEKFNPVAQVTKACRHNSPCIIVPPCQKSESLQTHYKYLVDCSQSPICVSVPLCIPCKKTVNLNKMSTKHIKDANNIEYQGTHCKFVPLRKQDIDINGVSTNNLEESHKSRDPYAHTFLKQTNVNPLFRSCRPNPSTSNCYKIDQSCQYVGCDTANNMQVRTENAKSEDVIYIRDVGCQFRAKPNKNKNNVHQHLNSQQTSRTVSEKNSIQSNQVTNSKRLLYEGNKMSHESEAEIESTDEDFVDESSHSVSSIHNIPRNPPRNRTCGFVPTGNMSQFIAYTRTEPVLNNHSSGSTIKGEVPYSETFSNISPTRVLSRRSFLKQKYKRIFCARRRRRPRVCSQDIDSSFGKMDQYKTIML